METDILQIEINTDNNDLLHIAQKYFSSGLEFLEKENFENALHCFSKAKDLFQKNKNQERTIESLIQISSLQLHFGNLNNAIEILELAGELNTSLNNRLLEADIYSTLGRILLTKTEYEKSVEFLDNSLVIYKEFNKAFKIHHTISILGIVFTRLGKYEESFQHLETSLHYFESISDEKKIAENLCYLGSYYLHISKYILALECFEKALNYFESKNSKEKYARTLQNIGVIYMVTNDLHKAFQLITECVEIYKELKMERDVASGYGSLGSIYRSLGKFEDSLKYYYLALRKHTELNILGSIASDYANIGIVYRHLKDYNTAINYLEKAISISNKTNNQLEIGMYIGNLGITYSQMEKYQEAEKHILLAISFFKNFDSTLEIAQFTAYLGVIYRNTQRFEEAVLCFTSTLEVFERLQRIDEVAAMMKEIALVYSDKLFIKYNPEIAEKHFLKSIEMLLILGNLGHLNILNLEIAKFYEKEGKFSEALEFHKKYLALFEEIQNNEVKKQADWYQWENKLAEKEREKEVLKIKIEAEKQRLEKDIELQSTKLQSTINELVSKNKILNKIQNEIKLLTQHTKPLGLNIIEKLSDFIERNISPIENESDFTKFFDETREKLKSIRNDLSSMEVKVSALLMLNLSTSNICSYLHLSKRTIETHRLNIRKKLQIPKNQDLTTYLHQLIN